MDHQRMWANAPTLDDFANEISTRWTSDYLAATAADPADIVVVEPGNGYSYLFDLAGELGGEPMPHAARVIGVWGRSAQPTTRRNRSRMSGFPRPRRGQDDRGHLIPHAAGGGYEINLVKMDASLNRGRSADGARFRAMERRAAATPGTFYFIHCTYADNTDRPSQFVVGVQNDAELITDDFANCSTDSTPMSTSAALRLAAAFPLDASAIADCLDLTIAKDALFDQAWRSGVGSLTRHERCAIAAVTGHVAESVTELLFDSIGWQILWHFAGPGLHGVDLVLLAPDDKVFAVEVKGTLVSGRFPRLSHRELAQMSGAWIDKTDNPGMTELGLDSSDIQGAVVAINLADRTWRAALTNNFKQLHPVTTLDQLHDLDWIVELS